jgi:LCP family protein required for cell wall assembly
MSPDHRDGGEQPDTPRATDPYRPRHDVRGPAPRPRRRWPIIVGSLVGVVAVGAGALVALYNDLQGNITTADVDHLLGDDRPDEGPADPDDPNAGEDLNIVVMGSDSREGDNGAQGGQGEIEGMRSDTTMIVHIAADRSRVDVVSIPRDTLVARPECELEDGTVIPANPNEQSFNASFFVGGQHGDVSAAAACTIATIEQMTDVRMDDFMVVDFAGFIGVVDALGGVPMYIDRDIDDSYAGLQIDQGCHVLDGQQALGVARSRHSLPTGSDVERIDQQQALVSAIARDALSSRVLFDVTRLYDVLDAGTESLTTSREMASISNIAGLAISLRGLSSDDITFLTMPWEPAGNRVTIAPEAEAVWEALRNDDPLPNGESATDEQLGDESATGDESSTGGDAGTETETLPTTGSGFGSSLVDEARQAAAAATGADTEPPTEAGTETTPETPSSDAGDESATETESDIPVCTR